MSQKLEFSKNLLNFLIRRGYTHLQLKGVLPRTAQSRRDINLDDYILKPWKPGIAFFKEADLQLEEINSTDVSDMLDVEFGIQFWVEMPDQEADAYKQESKI